MSFSMSIWHSTGCDAIDFDLDDPGIQLCLAARRFALLAKISASSARRHHGIHHGWHKLQFFHLGDRPLTLATDVANNSRAHNPRRRLSERSYGKVGHRDVHIGGCPGAGCIWRS